MATTPVYALPYPLGTDLVRDGDNVIQALAERVEALLAQRDVSSGSRNVIRNGDFRVAQRGAGPFTTTGGYGTDGWTLLYSGGTVNTQQGTSVATIVNGGEEATRYSLTGVTGQSAAGDYAMLLQRIEGVTTLNGRQVTLSFMGWASSAAKVGIEISQNFGTGGSPSAQVNTAIQAVDVTGTIGRKSVTFTIPSVAGKVLGSSGTDSLVITFWFSAGSSNAARASNIGIQTNNFALTDVQLEAGPLATPFERLPQQAQLAWCQRYFWRWQSSGINGAHMATGMFWSAGSAYFGVRYPVPMRAVPVATFVSAAGTWTAYGNTVAAAFTTLAQGTSTNEQAELSGACAGTGIAGGGALIRTTGATPVITDFSAEL